MNESSSLLCLKLVTLPSPLPPLPFPGHHQLEMAQLTIRVRELTEQLEVRGDCRAVLITCEIKYSKFTRSHNK